MQLRSGRIVGTTPSINDVKSSRRNAITSPYIDLTHDVDISSDVNDALDQNQYYSHPDCKAWSIRDVAHEPNNQITEVYKGIQGDLNPLQMLATASVAREKLDTIKTQVKQFEECNIAFQVETLLLALRNKDHIHSLPDIKHNTLQTAFRLVHNPLTEEQSRVVMDAINQFG